MFRSHNIKITVLGEGRGKYELFWIAENAEHIVKREQDPSHLISIKQVEKFAERTAYLVQGEKANHRLAYGLGVWRNKFYRVVCYLVEKPYKRCIIETCHVVNDQRTLAICKQYFFR